MHIPTHSWARNQGAFVVLAYPQGCQNGCITDASSLGANLISLRTSRSKRILQSICLMVAHQKKCEKRCRLAGLNTSHRFQRIAHTAQGDGPVLDRNELRFALVILQTSAIISKLQRFFKTCFEQMFDKDEMGEVRSPILLIKSPYPFFHADDTRAFLPKLLAPCRHYERVERKPCRHRPG